MKPYIIFLTLFVFCFGKVCSQDVQGEIVNYERKASVSNFELTEQVRIVLKVNNAKGDYLSKFRIPFTKGQKVNIEGKIIDQMGKEVRRLSRKDIIEISDISDFSLYEDDLVKQFELRHNRYPYYIDVTYVITGSKFLGIRWPLNPHNLYVQKCSFELLIPQNYKINIRKSGIGDPVVSLTEGGRLYRWEAAKLQSVEFEEWSPPVNEISPYIEIAPQLFYYGEEGSFESWETFGEWQSKIINGLDHFTEQESSFIRNLYSPVEKKREIIKDLYHYLQDNTRYINVSIDIGGLKPYPAEYVNQHKYGDCKGLTNYMNALLKVAGIPSYYVLVNAGDNPEVIDSEFPSQQFNHVITMVPLDKDTIWLENTSSDLPFGYLGTFTQGRKGLIVDNEKSRLINIPALRYKDVVDEKHININLLEGGDVKAEITNLCRGSSFESYNALQRNYPPDKQEQYLSYSLPFENYELLTWDISQSNRDSSEITVFAQVNLNHYIKNYGSYKLMPMVSFELPDFENPDTRKLPVRIPHPIVEQDTIQYVYEGFHINSLPREKQLISPFGEFQVKVNSQNGRITIYRRVVIHAGNYGVTDYESFYKFITAIKSWEKEERLILE